MLSKAASSTIFEFMVWHDLGTNTGLQEYWRTLYSLDQWLVCNVRYAIKPNQPTTHYLYKDIFFKLLRLERKKLKFVFVQFFFKQKRKKKIFLRKTATQKNIHFKFYLIHLFSAISSFIFCHCLKKINK